MYAKKSLGQHFLHAEGILDSIIEAGDVVGDDLILEIGPGKGSLTKPLVFFAGKVIAVEKDDELYENLKEKFKKEIENQRLDLIHQDILNFDPNVLSFYKDLSYKIIANIPYNITGSILRKFLTAEYKPETMVLLVQKEVAERIVAQDGKESILSLSVKVFGEPKYVKTVKAGSFTPPPQVDSAILAIKNINNDFFGGKTDKVNENKFFELVKTGFKSKRKKLSSNLSEIYPKNKVLEVFEKLKLDPNLRAEDASLEIWKKLVELL